MNVRDVVESTLALVVFASAASFLYCAGLVAWYDVLQRTAVSRLYALLFLMPVLSVLISVVVRSETFTFLDIVFSGLTLLGVAITQFGKKQLG